MRSWIGLDWIGSISFRMDGNVSLSGNMVYVNLYIQYMCLDNLLVEDIGREGLTFSILCLFILHCL